MIFVPRGMSLRANAPSPWIDDWRNSNHSLSFCGGGDGRCSTGGAPAMPARTLFVGVLVGMSQWYKPRASYRRGSRSPGARFQQQSAKIIVALRAELGLRRERALLGQRDLARVATSGGCEEYHERSP